MTLEEEKENGDSEHYGSIKIDAHKLPKVKFTTFARRLVDLFANPSVKPWEMVEIFMGIQEDFRSGSNSDFKDCVSQAASAIGATLAAEPDGGISRKSDARDYAVDLFSYYYTMTVDSTFSPWTDSSRCASGLDCAKAFAACYGWNDSNGGDLSSELDRIVDDSWDRLGVPRHYWKGSNPIEVEAARRILIGKQFYDAGCSMTRTIDSQGKPECTHFFGIEPDFVRDYIDAFTDVAVSPIEVRDIIRSAIKEALDLEYISRSGLIGDPDKVAWRHQRINTFIENKLITKQSVDEIRSEVLRDWDPAEVCVPVIHSSITGSGKLTNPVTKIQPNTNTKFSFDYMTDDEKIRG